MLGRITTLGTTRGRGAGSRSSARLETRGEGFSSSERRRSEYSTLRRRDPTDPDPDPSSSRGAGAGLFSHRSRSGPFGGVGASGQGRYHGQSGFDALSNLKPVLHKPVKPEVSMMYPPYTKLKSKLLKKLV